MMGIGFPELMVILVIIMIIFGLENCRRSVRLLEEVLKTLKAR